MLIDLWFRNYVYFIHEPKELFELKHRKSKLQIQYSVKEGRLNSHVYPPPSSKPPLNLHELKTINLKKQREQKKPSAGKLFEE